MRFLKLLFSLPQTYGLAIGVGVGFGLWVAFMGLRLAVLAIGLAIALLTLLVWSWQVAQLPQLRHQLAPEHSANLLDATVYANRIDRLRVKFHPSIQNSHSDKADLWQQALDWGQSCQTVAVAIAERHSAIFGELTETLYTVLGLLEQVGQAIQVIGEVETLPYRQLAQKKLDTSFNRLEVTYQHLQVLRDQLALSSLSPENEGNQLPVNLQVLIQANAAALKLSEDQ